METQRTITIVHFNDVYNIESATQEPVGGAARFMTAIRSLSDRDPLILFSGDALNPSLMSSVTQGRQMVPVLNAVGVHCALYGNHDFDHGVDNLVKISQETNFPWLLSNVYDLTTDGGVLADGKISYVMTWHGKKLGLIGLIEEEWMATLSTIDPEDLEYVDFVTEGRRLARELRAEDGVDYVIALTHMRWPNDIRLAENVDEIDLILGGHDHEYGWREVSGRTIVKSGTDFRNYSVVTLTFTDDGHVAVDVQEMRVDSSIHEDEQVCSIVAEYTQLMGEQMDSVLGQIDVDLDGRFEIVRRQESNLGNFIADIMLRSTEADLAILNSGTLRSDRVHHRGEFRVMDLMSILPMVDSLVVIAVTGTQIVDALENGVSKYPALEGRFPQVAGVSFSFDPLKPPGGRVSADSVLIGTEPLNLNQTYRLCTKAYLAKGKDGYDCLSSCELLVNEDDGPQLSTCVLNHFQSVNYLTGLHKFKYYHHQSIISRCQRRRLSRQATIVEHDETDLTNTGHSSGEVHDGRSSSDGRQSSGGRRRWQKARIALTFTRHRFIADAESKEIKVALAPKIQQRIRNLADATA